MSNFEDLKQFQFPRLTPERVDLRMGLWLKLTALTLPEGSIAGALTGGLAGVQPPQQANARAPITTLLEGTEIELLLPSSFQLGLSHEWAAYDSLTSKLAEKAAAYYKMTQGAAGLGSGIINMAKSLLGGQGLFTSSLNSLVNLGTIANTRVDSPMVYKSSSPVEYNLVFEFVAYGKEDVRYLQAIIKKLLMLSSPKYPSAGAYDLNTKTPIFIKPPNVFRVESWNPSSKSLNPDVKPINIQIAAITSIQPNWKAPYRDGGATAMDLTMTLRDITPVFDRNFDDGASVKVTVNSTTIQPQPPAPAGSGGGGGGGG